MICSTPCFQMKCRRQFCSTLSILFFAPFCLLSHDHSGPLSLSLSCSLFHSAAAPVLAALPGGLVAGAADGHLLVYRGVVDAAKRQAARDAAQQVRTADRDETKLRGRALILILMLSVYELNQSVS